MFFSTYHPLKDELMHVLLSALVAGTGLFLGLYRFELFSICFLIGILIDLDHLFNRSLGKALKLKNFQTGVAYGSNGYTIKILHGFDVALLTGLLLYNTTNLLGFSIFVTLTLVVHALWDFLVYPHSPRELLLITRMKCGFKPGMRTFLIGTVFKLSSLKY